MFDKIKRLLWKRKYIFLFFGLFLIVLTQRFLNERQNGLINSVSSDGLGYYCYLPAAVIYQDFNYTFYDKPENKINPFYHPALNPYKETKALNKYYCGTSICLLPFFIVGIAISAVAGTEINGYTDTFLMLVSVAALFYFLLSTFLITRIGRYFSVSEKTSVVACLIFFFSTNLFHYTIQEPSMSHVYSFFGVSLFFYLYVRLLQNTSNKALFFLGLSLGLVALIRPVNVVVVLFTPFFSQSINHYFLFLKTLFINYWKGIVLMVLAVIAAIVLQFTFYYLQTGDFFIVSYEGETFNFANPEIYNVLFSYRKGLFVYVPILFASLIFIILSKNNWYKKTIFFLAFSVFIYITSSWWCWWYGGGFSIRPVIDFLPVFIITTILLYSKLSTNIKRVVLTLTVPFVFFGQLMAYQYSNRLMDSSEMNKDKFWDLFLEVDLAAINQKKIDRLLKNNTIIKSEEQTFEDITDSNRIENSGYKSKKSCIVNNENPYSIGFGFPLRDLHIDESFYIIAECRAKTPKEAKDLALAISIDDNGPIIGWFVVFKNQFKDDEDGWSKLTNVVEIDKSFITDKSYLKIFANSSKGKSLVDDLKYTIVKK